MLRSATLALLFLMSPAIAAVAADPPEQIGAWTVVPYGSSNPVLSCMPLGACLVALEDGETIQGRFLPDSARWQVEPGTTGTEQRIPVLAIKPKECGISTNLFVTTDRRVYTFLLTSPDCNPTQMTVQTIKFDQIRFTYPQEFARLWQEPALPLPAAGTATGASRVDQLSFDYSWSAGCHAVKPRTVYDDGSKTYIVLNPEDAKRDAPAVFIEGDHGKLEAVNFSPPPSGGSTYTVDRVVPKLALISGSGSDQKTIITRRKGR